jgi:CBS domain-containing protein
MEFTHPVRLLLARKRSTICSISAHAPVRDALVMMAEEDIGALAVMEMGRPLGIFSERDYARKVILLGRSSADTPVSEVMSHPPPCVSPEETVDSCMRMMTARRIRHLLITEHDKVTGIVSIGDLVSWIISVQADTIGQLHSYIAGSYPQ